MVGWSQVLGAETTGRRKITHLKDVYDKNTHMIEIELTDFHPPTIVYESMKWSLVVIRNRAPDKRILNGPFPMISLQL